MARTGRSNAGGRPRSRLARFRAWAKDFHHRHVTARLRPAGPGRDQVERYLTTGASLPAGARSRPSGRHQRRRR